MILKKNKTLNIHYYNAIKKAIFKPSAFFKGIILPLAQDCTAKEAAIIGSILKKCSIPVAHSSACLMKLIELCGKEIKMGCLFFMKIILLKKYALPTQVKVGLINFFMKFMDVSYEQSHPKIEDLNKKKVWLLINIGCLFYGIRRCLFLFSFTNLILVRKRI